MSILIRGMEMPENCKSCRFSGLGGIKGELNICMFTGQNQLTLSPDRMSKCPLIPIPPHGRLIDKDALLEDIDSNHIVTPSDDGNLVEVYGAEKVLAHIAYAPTVIEKDGE